MLDYTQANVLAVFRSNTSQQWQDFGAGLENDPVYTMTSLFAIPPRFLSGYQNLPNWDWQIFATGAYRSAWAVLNNIPVEYDVIINDGGGDTIPGITIVIDIKYSKTLDPILSFHIVHST